MALGWLLASFVGVGVGGYFRDHYYIQTIPALAVLAGRGVERWVARWPEPRAGRIAAGCVTAAVAWGVAVAPWYYLSGTPAER